MHRDTAGEISVKIAVALQQHHFWPYGIGYVFRPAMVRQWNPPTSGSAFLLAEKEHLESCAGIHNHPTGSTRKYHTPEVHQHHHQKRHVRSEMGVKFEQRELA